MKISKFIIPVLIIGLVGGLVESLTGWSKIWCFLIGVAAFYLFVFVKSILITIRIMRKTKGEER